MEENINNIKKIPGRKKNSIRNYFIVKDNLLFCNVDNCNCTYSINSSTSTLRYHIYTDHVKIVGNNIKNNDIQMINIKTDKKISFNTRIALAFAKNSLPIP